MSDHDLDIQTSRVLNRLQSDDQEAANVVQQLFARYQQMGKALRAWEPFIEGATRSDPVFHADRMQLVNDALRPEKEDPETPRFGDHVHIRDQNITGMYYGEDYGSQEPQAKVRTPQGVVLAAPDQLELLPGDEHELMDDEEDTLSPG